MSDIQRGTTFVNGNTYQGNDLNNLVDNAVILPAFITNKTQKLLPVSSDQLVIADSEAGNALKKVTIAGISTALGSIRQSYGLTDTGTANNYLFVTTPVTASYLSGDIFIGKFANLNTGTSQLNLNSLGAKNIFKNGSALVGGEVPAGSEISFQYDGTNFNIIDSGIANKSLTSTQFSNIVISRNLCQGRLCLTSLTPVHTSDVSGSTLYFTPFRGNNISLYDGTNWNLYAFSQISLALTASSGENYDVFIYDNAGVLTLETAQWTNNTTRATALVLQDGVYCKSGALTRRYLGSFRASATNTTKIGFGTLAANGGQAQVFLWNYYNRVPFETFVGDTTNSWTYATATWRSANGQATNSAQIMFGLVEDPIRATYTAQGLPGSATNAVIGIGMNNTGTMTGTPGYLQGQFIMSCESNYRGFSGVVAGVNTINAIENTPSGTVTWYGDNNAPSYTQNGLFVGGMY